MGRPINTSRIKQADTKGIESLWTLQRVRRAATQAALLFIFCIAPGLAQDTAAKDLRMFYQQSQEGAISLGSLNEAPF